MKLEPNCVRDLLLTLEEVESIDDEGFLKGFSINQFIKAKRMSKYSRGQILYTFRMIKDGGLVSYHGHYQGGMFIHQFGTEDGITYAGHQFLASIRDNTVWRKALDKLANISGTASLAIIKTLCDGIIQTMLTL